MLYSPSSTVEPGARRSDRRILVTHARALRRTIAATLYLPPRWLPMTDTPLSQDAARLLSKLHTIARETL